MTDRNKPYIQNMGKVLLLIIIVLTSLDIVEYRFRSQILTEQNNQESIRLLVRDHMNLIEDMISDAIVLIQSKSIQQMETRRSEVRQTMNEMTILHRELMQASVSVGARLVSLSLNHKHKEAKLSANELLIINPDEDNPLKILHNYYHVLKNNIDNLLSFELDILQSLSQNSEIVREFLYEDPFIFENDQEGDSIAYEFDMGKLAQMFNHINQEQQQHSVNLEYWIWCIKMGFRFLAFFTVLRLWLIVLRKEEEIYTDKLQLDQHHKEDQLNVDIAKNLFVLINGFIPRYLSLPRGLSLFCESIISPCHSEGGDHSGIIKVGDCYYFYLADQSGHEVTTVLSSAQTAIMFRRAITRSCKGDVEVCPCHIVSRVMQSMNEALCSIYPEGHYCTMIIGKIHIHTLQMQYVVAGHPSFYVIRGEDLIVLPEGVSGRSGMMGILEDTEYRENTFQLQPEDKMILLTDGFSEASDPQAEKRIEFGDARIQATISKYATRSLGLIYDQLCTAVTDFSSRKLARISERVPDIDLATRRVANLVNDLDDDASVMLLKIEDMNVFDKVFEFTPADEDELNNKIDDLKKYLKQVLDSQGFARDLFFSFQVSLDEAVTNAWKHGNQEKPLSIKVTFRISNDLIVQVYDHGTGVDPRNVPDPTCSDNLIKPSGRGMLMIRRFSSETRWFQPSSDEYSFCVRMVWRHYPDDNEKDQVKKMSEASLLNFRPRRDDLEAQKKVFFT